MVLKKISRAERQLGVNRVNSCFSALSFVSEYFVYRHLFLPTYLKCAFLPKKHINGSSTIAINVLFSL